MQKKLKYLWSILLLTMCMTVGCQTLTEAEETTGQNSEQFSVEENDKQDEESNPEQEIEQDSQQTLSEQSKQQDKESNLTETDEDLEIEETGSYTSKDDVAAYLHLYNHLPDNFITKKEAEALGWVSKEGNLAEVAPGKSIGGDYFGNYEGNLPKEEGKEYHECDIDSDGGYRGAKRIVYSNDGYIYYTEDHYETFEQLYGGE